MDVMDEASLKQFDVPDHIPRDRIYDFDMYNPAGNGEKDYYDIWRTLQEPGVPDIIWTPHNEGHWIATRGSTVSEVLKDYTRFTSEIFFIPKTMGAEWDGLPSMLNPPEHTPYRQILNRYMGRDKIMAMEPEIRALSIELIEAFAADGHCELKSQLADIFPIKMFLALTKLPYEDADKLLRYVAMMMKPEGTAEEMADSLVRGKKALYDYIAPVLAERTANPGSDIISGIAHATVDGRPLTTDEKNRLITIVLLGGLDTVLNFIPVCFAHLAQHPDVVEEIHKNADRLAMVSEELFRRFPLVNEGRMVAKDIEYDGVLLKAGDMVLAPTTMHGIDDRENECPMKVDFTRKKKSHSTFGAGAHVCAGMHLARIEVMILLEEWLKRIPRFRMKPGFKFITRSGIIGSADALELEWDVN
ncbi:cytochrome P450 [Sphingobium sp. Cam5-1]|uniref:cytochrome P450 n=1 Tax=Sphingobium sp. Cam5-1 TaxID=2789327 RepID=UPI0018AD2E05|nr:cytochrome P450 [Sphingobium sp. Cam5-1]QPI75101.1 cytochrome P450 [Sphingobium sp. Cam5-1]